MKHHQRGMTLIEMLIATAVVSLTMTAVFNLVVGTGRAAASYERTSSLGRYSRMAIDEVLYQTRSAESVLSSAMINGRRVYTSATTAVIRLPAYNTNSPTLFLDNAWDIVAFEYESDTRTLYETVQPASGSARVAHVRRPIARNVKDLEFIYTARQSYQTVTLGLQVFALSAPLAITVNALSGGSSSAVQVFVDGVPTAVNNILGLTIVTASAPLGATVQALYPVAPWLDGGLSLTFVDSLRISLTLEDPTTAQGSITLQGDSTLRNHTAPQPTLSSILSSIL